MSDVFLEIRIRDGNGVWATANFKCRDELRRIVLVTVSVKGFNMNITGNRCLHSYGAEEL